VVVTFDDNGKALSKKLSAFRYGISPLELAFVALRLRRAQPPSEVLVDEGF
jgi:hypothetical protein